MCSGFNFVLLQITLSNFLCNWWIKTSLLLEFFSSGKPESFCLHFKLNNLLLSYSCIWIVFQPQTPMGELTPYSLAFGTTLTKLLQITSEKIIWTFVTYLMLILLNSTVFGSFTVANGMVSYLFIWGVFSVEISKVRILMNVEECYRIVEQGRVWDYLCVMTKIAVTKKINKMV